MGSLLKEGLRSTAPEPLGQAFLRSRCPSWACHSCWHRLFSYSIFPWEGQVCPHPPLIVFLSVQEKESYKRKKGSQLRPLSLTNELELDEILFSPA